jgi:hypothetical protein
MSTTLVSTTTHGTPTGNYDGSSTSFTSDTTKGDGYFGYTDGLHTISLKTNGFVGTITVEGTLVDNPTSSDWFTLRDDSGNNLIYGDGSTVLTTSVVNNFIANTVHVRAKIDSFTAGSITKIQFNY